MDEREFGEMLQRLLEQDLSIGTEGFRDKLLARCLDVLGADSQALDGVFCDELTDAELELLAAGGDPIVPGGAIPFIEDGS